MNDVNLKTVSDLFHIQLFFEVWITTCSLKKQINFLLLSLNVHEKYEFYLDFKLELNCILFTP
jgi:hypothetical protein